MPQRNHFFHFLFCCKGTKRQREWTHRIPLCKNRVNRMIFFCNYIYLLSAALEENSQNDSPPAGEDDSDGGETPISPEEPESRVLLGPQTSITTNSLFDQIQREFSIFWTPSEKICYDRRRRHTS